VEAHLAMAEEYGAELKFNEPMLQWRVLDTPSSSLDSAPLIEVETSLGVYRTHHLVLAVGAWADQIYGSDISQHMQLRVERKVLYWFNPLLDKNSNEENLDVEVISNLPPPPPPTNPRISYDGIPVYIWDLGEG